MVQEIVNPDNFEEWQYHPVTRRLMRLLKEDREAMKEGLINNQFLNEDEVKGRCRALALLLDISYEDLSIQKD